MNVRTRLTDKRTRAILSREAIIEQCARSVPTHWRDSLLSDPDAPKVPMDNRGVEKLLLGIRNRIRALKASP